MVRSVAYYHRYQACGLDSSMLLTSCLVFCRCGALAHRSNRGAMGRFGYSDQVAMNVELALRLSYRHPYLSRHRWGFLERSSSCLEISMKTEDLVGEVGWISPSLDDDLLGLATCTFLSFWEKTG